jgi:hypothetical protein
VVPKVVVLALLCGCFIDRKSEELRCDTTGDCTNGRTCENNYCVGNATPLFDALCPPQCSACNATTLSCTINGAGGDDITCPVGWNCTINCITPDACHDVTCSTGSCTVMCTATEGCHDINCGVGRCTVTCSAPDACHDISCAASCACDVTCPTGNCNTSTCPANGANQCTTTGAAGAPCLSTAMGSCSRC